MQDVDCHLGNLEDGDDSISPKMTHNQLGLSSPFSDSFPPLMNPTFPSAEDLALYTQGLLRSRRSSETALTAALPPFAHRERSASINSTGGHRRVFSSSALFANNEGASLAQCNDFLSPHQDYQRQAQPSLQVITDLSYDTCILSPCSASPALTPASSSSSSFGSPEEFRNQRSALSDYSDSSVVSPPYGCDGTDTVYQTPSSLLFHPDSSRGRTLWRPDVYLTPSLNSRSPSLASMPNMGDLDHDIFRSREPSMARSIHSDNGIDFLTLKQLDLNPVDVSPALVATSEIFGTEQETSHTATDPSSASLTSYREQVASDAVTRASQSRRTNAANYVCEQCKQTFTAKHNLHNHLNSHYGVRNFQCPIPGCNKAFGTSHVRRRHLVKCHSGSIEAKRRKPCKRRLS